MSDSLQREIHLCEKSPENAARNILRLLAKVEELEAAQRWIPVAEKLPNDWVHVCTDKGVCYLDDEGYWNESIAEMNEVEVSIWRALPIAPTTQDATEQEK